MVKLEKREEIIGAALELIAEHGFHGAPMAMIAKKAKVAAGTIYRFFESKDDLINETFACLEGQMLASVMAHYPEGRPGTGTLRHLAADSFPLPGGLV